MDYHYSIKVISEKDLLDAGCFNMKALIAVCEQALRDYKNRMVIFPEKVSVVFDETTQNRINCLPAGLPNESVYGMKWVSVFPTNPHQINRPNVSSVILLSEMKSGFPIALLEGGMCTSLRTAAVGAIAAKHLAKSGAQTIGIIGAGELGKAHLLSMKTVLPDLKICRISSRTQKSAENFIAQMSRFFPDMDFEDCGTDYRKTVLDTDVVVTAISGQSKILQANWIADGTFYCHVAGLEDDFGVAEKADKIVCDKWETVKQRTQTISQMYRQGLLTDLDIYADLDEIVTGEKVGRENNHEFIYFNSVGLSFIDIKVANWMYKKVVETDLGCDVEIKNETIFDMPEKLR